MPLLAAIVSLVAIAPLAQTAPESPGAAPTANVDAPVNPVTGQNTTNSLLAPPPPDQKITTIVVGGGGYQFRTDLDDGGSLALTRAVAGTQVRYAFTDTLALGLNFGFRFDRYEWGGDAFPALGPSADPWRDIFTVGIGAVMNWQVDDRWTVSGGPIFQFSGESSVEAGDAFSGGGLVGAAYRVNDDLLIGGGVGVVTRIEDDPLVFPQIVLDWRISDAWRLTTRGGPTAVLRQALELVYAPDKQLEFAVGARGEYLRFRLDDQAIAPDGIGEEESVPMWLRASWKPLPRLRLDLYAGVTIWSQFTVSDSVGGVVARDTLEPAPFVAGYVSWTF